MRFGFKFCFELGLANEAVTFHFPLIGFDGAIVHTGKYMIEFVFGEAIVEIGFVRKMKAFFEFGNKTHFFLQAALGSLGHGFAGLRMAAAGIRPQTGTVVFVVGPLLEQPFALAVENENAERPVQEPFFMGFHFFHHAQCFVVFVYENYFHK